MMNMLNDSAASDEIMEYLSSLKMKQFDDFQIMRKLNLPIEQVDRVLDRLILEGKIGERK